MTEFAKKLQLRSVERLLLLQAPEEVVETMAQEELTFTRADEAPSVGVYQAVLLFVQSKKELESWSAQALSLLEPEGLLWIAYPKKSSGIKTDLNRDEGWQTMKQLGYEGVRQVAIDEVWSALRFRHQKERSRASAFGVDMPGIDRKTKTVTVPKDLEKALQEAALLEEFERLAFTHRKEYVVAVLEAKRPETRARRVAKAVEGVRKSTGKEKQTK